MKRTLQALGVATLLVTAASAPAAALNPLLASWLAAQTNIQSWSADFVQTRSFKALTQPLTATGHVWFAAPNRFRWELGKPAQTIALRAPQELFIFYPRLKRVERFPLTGPRTGPWRDALQLLEAGFPRSDADLQRQYVILSQNVTAEACELTLEPKSAAARKMMPRIKIDFDTKNYALRGTQLKFADGSTMRNDFKDQFLNPRIDDRLFSPEIPSDYKVVEPFAK